MTSLRAVLPYYRPYRGAMALGLAFVALAAAFSSTVPWVMRRAIDALGDGSALSTLWWLGAVMIGLSLVGGAFRFGMRELLNGVSRRIEYDLRNALFAHLETLDATYYGRTRTGELMARLTNDLSAVRMAAGPAIMYLMNTIAGGAFALGYMLRIDFRLTAYAVAPMAFLPLVMARLGHAIHVRFEQVQEEFGHLTTRAQENLSGTRIVRAYRQEGPERARFGALNERYLEQNLRLARLYGLMNPMFGALAGLGAVLVLWLGGARVLRGEISIGSFVAFGVYLGILTWPLIALGWVINLFQRGAASMGRLNEILAARSALPAAAAPRALPPLAVRADGGPSGGGRAAARGRSIEFRDVGFHYPAPAGGAPRWVLRHISFTAPAGSTLGVVGATGSGKSALVDLLPRLYDPQEGEILIDGVPIRDLPLDVLRREIGMVPQESLLFSDTIGANLRYAGADAAAARWAAGVAQLTATIDALPAREETMLGERGINLSGGQKQRAAMARALARQPSIIVFDDALSAVDTQTEAAILASLRDAVAGRTAVIASHRVSALRAATWIIVLDGGTIVEQGRHENLMAAGGRYWSLLRRQQLEEEVEAGVGEGLTNNE